MGRRGAPERADGLIWSDLLHLRGLWIKVLFIAGLVTLVLVVLIQVALPLVHVLAPPPPTREPEARAVCRNAVTQQFESPTKVIFGPQKAVEVRKGNWVVSGMAKTVDSLGHVVKADYDCTIAEGALVRPWPHTDAWFTIRRR